ncbi:hypothetical protein SRABI06_02966 [Pseudomonas brassicacearum]|nr:hypothetical protein SRABI06_02966 [Pseudomonas brassicacearum]
MPSLGEAPSGGAKAFCLLLRSSKVSRRQGGTLSRRDRSNGYTHQSPKNEAKKNGAPHLRRSAVFLKQLKFKNQSMYSNNLTIF